MMKNNKQILKKGKANQIKIMSQKCAGYVMYHGCHIVRTELNENNPYYQVFIFYNDAKVQKWLERYSKENNISIGNTEKRAVLKENKDECKEFQSKPKDYQN